MTIMPLILNRALALLAITVGLVGCGKEDPMTTPEGGYEAFTEAFFSGNVDLMWDALSDDTHTLFIDGFSTLRSMERMIDELQPSDRESAIRGTSVYLLERMDDATDLFAYVLYWENLPTEQEFVEGLKMDSVELAEDDIAIVTTVTGQEFEMVRDSDGYWHVRQPLLDVFASALSVIQDNRSNLEMAISLYGDQSEAHRELERLLGITPSETQAAPADTTPTDDEAGTAEAE